MVKIEGIFKKSPVHLLIIISVAFLSYFNTFSAPFQFDDEIIIKNNPIITDIKYFSEPSRLKDIKDSFQIKEFRNRYIGILSFALNYKIHGLDVAGYHILNLLIHIGNALLIYFFIILGFKTPFLCRTAITHNAKQLAFFIALLFVCHPIQTGAVTYIWQRMTSLAAFFYLFSLVAYIKWRLGIQNSGNISRLSENRIIINFKSAFWYSLSVISAVLAMKTKQIAFTLPVIITLYEFMFFEGNNKKRILCLIPLILTILIIPISLLLQDNLTGDIIGDVGEVTRDLSDMSRQEYLFTQFRVIVTYIRLLFFPINQNLDYDYPVYHSFLDPNVFLSFLFLLSIFGIGVFLLHRSRIKNHALRLAAFGIFWFFITLSVESSVIPIADMIFEHRVYLPSVGFLIALTAAIEAKRERWENSTKYARPVFVSVMILTVFALSIATYARNTLWKDSVRLWENTVNGSPNKPRCLNNLGLAYAEQGRIDEAIKEYRIAIRLKPDYADAHNNLGLAYAEQGRTDEVIKEYRIAIRLKPDIADYHNNLGLAYAEQGHIDEAVKEFKIALHLKPDYAVGYYNLGLAYAEQGRIDEAVKEYQIAIQLKPDYADARNNLGIAYAEQGHIDKAFNEFKTVLKLKPDDVDARKNLEILSDRMKSPDRKKLK